MLTINLKRGLTRSEAERAVRRVIPELRRADLTLAEDGTNGRWWWGAPDYRYGWSGYVHEDGAVEGPY